MLRPSMASPSSFFQPSFSGVLARFRSRALLASLFLPLVGCASCGQQSLCTFRGTVNAPENRTMRRNLMAKGLDQFCRQMLSRNAPLRLQNDQPVIGRFYPSQCNQMEMGNGDLYVRFSGPGYGYTNITKKLAFTMSGAVQYNQDFLVAEDECNIYGYFRPRNVQSSDFKITRIEQEMASFINQLNPMGDSFGQQLVAGKLKDGFTVIQLSDGSSEFGLGMIPLGKRTPKKVMVRSDGRMTYENDRVEVHQGERDFIGPIEITEGGQALYLTFKVDGGVPVDAFVMTKFAGDQALRQYLDLPQPAAFPQPAFWTDVVPAQMPDYRRTIPLAPGMYYVVLDNTNTAGAVAPPQGNPGGDAAALVDYAIQIGEAP